MEELRQLEEHKSSNVLGIKHPLSVVRASGGGAHKKELGDLQRKGLLRDQSPFIGWLHGPMGAL